MSDPAVSIGVTDGGAHTKSNTHGHYGTDLLIWLVREEGLMSLEAIHHQLALKPAQSMLMKDRGAVLPGFWADLLVYDLNELHVDLNRAQILHDMPEGDWRRAVRAGGYSRILVNGVTTHIDDERTGANPGQVVQVTRDGEHFLEAAE
jgi:N-acyl-D-aspartate/D-glutamate deacylase